MDQTGSVTLSVTIPRREFPTAGARIDITLASGLIASIENRSGSLLPAAADRAPNTLRYAPVNTASRNAEEVHAAINRRVGGRNRPARYTLCDLKGMRIVTSLRHEPLESVTCKQCRRQLVEDGVLDEG